MISNKKDYKSMSYVRLTLDLLIIFDSKQKILYVNEPFTASTGYFIDDVQDEDFFKFFCPENVEQVKEAIAEFIQTKRSMEMFKCRYIKKNGSLIWLSWNLGHDDQEGLSYWSARDITESVLVKEKLFFFSTAFDKAKDAIIIAKNIGTYEDPIPAITYANQTFLDYSGYSLEEVIGQNPRIMRANNSNQSVVAKMKIALKKWESINIEVKNQTKDGVDIWVSLSISPIANEEGVFTHWISIQKDITARILKEERLRFFESVVENSNDSVIITEVQPIYHSYGPKIVYVNEAFCELTGYTRAEAIGNTPRMLQGVETSEKAKKNIGNALKNWQPIQQDILNYKKNGEIFWVNLSIVLVANKNGWFTHWVSFQQDVTERVKLKHELELKVKERTLALEQSNRKLDAFASVVSHDLKAPLRMITSYLELLKRNITKKLGEEVIITTYKDEMEYLAYAQQGGIDAHNLIQGVLEYSRTKTDDESTWKMIDLNRKIDLIRFLIKNDIEIVSANIVVADLPEIRGNSVQIQQLFQNLIVNAIKFRSERPCEIKIGFKKCKQGYLFFIEDNGIGMYPEDESFIFDLFGRAKTQNKTQGQGIGLSICKEIVENHNGEIWMETKIGKGSIFYFTIGGSKS
jgi:PAS domain S-box-containing protein